ncbi:MAG: hypothetical protein AAFV27_11070 [Pseudomonadota bacterium]
MAEAIDDPLASTGSGTSRFPGVRPFEDTADHRSLFHGRDNEKYELFQFVLAERIVLLFSRSGLGKSSLINAGLLEQLRQEGHFPIVVRVSGAATPQEALLEGFEGAVREAEELGLECEPEPKDWDRRSLWHLFKSVELWRDDELLSPVLIIDQFEELFTLHDVAARKAFIDELAHLVRGTRPRSVSQDAEPHYSSRAPDVKVVLAFREDFYANIQELRDQVPAVYKAPFRLGPLTREKALQAITKPAVFPGARFRTQPFEWDPTALEEVLDFLGEQQLGEGKTIVGQEIEPFQLQLICQHVEDLVATQNIDVITPETLGGRDALRAVLANFYTDTLGRICAAFPEQLDLREKLERLCEDGLMTPRGRRLLREESTIQHEDGVGIDVLSKMVELRLVRKEPRIGDNYYELTHDTLIEPIRQSRVARQKTAETSALSEEVSRHRKHQDQVESFARQMGVGAFASVALLLVYLFAFSPANELSAVISKVEAFQENAPPAQIVRWSTSPAPAEDGG